ncbi:MAG TPA: right-handed parallel beta-helix repeat-containing protein [Bryobacteraceae bacterium]|nr:right-handed parallel beta-helix repeat-containing protein [Bryobacteraceae bacterium]
MFQTSRAYVCRNKTLVAACAVLAAGGWQSARAAILCVSQTGASGCQTTISAAVASAAPGDTIQVGAGTYKETVTITQSQSLIGAGSSTTIIDATNLPNGIVVNNSAGAISGVVITGFTVQNANFQGIVVENASAVTIWNNQVLNNNKSLNITTNPPSCPGLPAALQAGEGFDCGEGVHLTGVDHSVVSNNVIQNNAGGILISDDMGATHDNVIIANVVSNNPYDCGITIASHSGKGVYHNTITGNTAMNNGNKLPGAGAGVGIFAPGPGSKAYGNVVVNNTLKGNGLPGVAIHNHAAFASAPPIDLDDNVIVGNIISSNGADTEDTATPGSAGINIASVGPINGIVVSQNVISQESDGLVFNGHGQVQASLNNFMAPSGVVNLGGGAINATQNWWGCATGANTGGCGLATGANVTTSAWLTAPFNSTQLPSPVVPPPPGGGASAITIVVTALNGLTAGTNSFVVTNSQITLSASQSTSSNAGALSFAWTPVQGYPIPGINGGNTSTPILQLLSPGTYQLLLTVTDATGAQATATVTIQYV